MIPTNDKTLTDGAEFHDSFATVQDYTLHIRANAQSDRQVVVLVHGIGMSEKYYRRFADILAHSYDVIAVDLPGYGKAEKPAEVLNLEQLAGVLKTFIDARGITEPILVGQSMGCQIVTHFAVLYPNVAKKLILLSPTINKNERSAFIQLLRLLQDTTRESLTGNVTVLGAYLKFGLRRYFITQRVMIKDQPETMLSLITVPILIVRGTRDKIVPKDWAHTLLQAAQRGLLRKIEGGPHNFQWTHPQEAASLCTDFIGE
jgi:pimeloyl-ACP methyl ester carboxylesterase